MDVELEVELVEVVVSRAVVVVLVETEELVDEVEIDRLVLLEVDEVLILVLAEVDVL